MASKRVTDHVEHKLVLGLADYPDPDDGGKVKKHIECTYSTGHKIRGPNAHAFPHPAIHVSVSEQDTIHWAGSAPFTITIPNVPTGLFFRPQPWHSSLGKDGLNHVNSGPANPAAAQFLPAKGLPVEFKAFKRISDTSTDPDPSVVHLDPHIVIEP